MHGASCASRTRPVPVERVRPDTERADDGDRRRGAELLGRAFADGLIDDAELERRLSLTFGAATLGELRAVTADLPPAWLARIEATAQRGREAVERRQQRRGEVRAYLAVMALLLGIWAMTALTAGASHPWPLWPALGWGIPLLLGARADRAQPMPQLQAPGYPDGRAPG